MATEKITPSLTIVRQYQSTPDKVWNSWTTSAALKQWMAPSRDFTTTVVELDVRVGGRYRINMKGPDGAEHDISGVYRRITPQRKLEFTWSWKSTPERESLVVIELRPTAQGTELTLTHSQFVDQEACDRHNEGWHGCLGQLEQFLLLSAA
jgi:uncharacterized protein YndB with AHSA1/START domain